MMSSAFARASAQSFAVYNQQKYYLHRDLFLDTFHRFDRFADDLRELGVAVS